MKKLFALSLVFMLVFGFDCVVCKHRIGVLEEELARKDTLLHKKDVLIERYDSIVGEILDR